MNAPWWKKKFFKKQVITYITYNRIFVNHWTQNQPFRWRNSKIIFCKVMHKIILELNFFSSIMTVPSKKF
ncbi:MAG: hypothetical protein A3I44_03950 [Candidatus Sungbacteria bacterium RIFCSPLOWO2_02_FULL_51_17]|uniref:Uncharacterized protein n=1 Tax=Candidatus Sungbacteria bacterium RIFCSPHIGHO2_02_FULL_51_29 TaxID=1802273 RepID=A0A1G2KSI1_9BACT|nr:MAG: hypothetical protein A2676_02470 [Candidatus Sungbacteria bacterium RIFCSPHIGHO2_01_FULL_51_22]OHA02244.1 MAG: hypothetical protein A3C16_04060 [Candidatus Sungbacteria bacterium RIFCSPHIGHO2_02_FULL_51_29]OHA06070.1 MAG: hypothetical protein A3B29_05365 [Candidatus Sungbacteria bacterium RIFCSPLOWO2_01_FULL_51_34]OHA11239.1 MAG: hypothetical protein A3I44_03950 [Candidatus Sungbacteria bacterium RIFCSPLOWO2_02_FULL_51_17]